MVIGPSFISDTFISAPKTPVCTFLSILSDKLEINCSYNGIAKVGLAALIKDGRLPFFI